MISAHPYLLQQKSAGSDRGGGAAVWPAAWLVFQPSNWRRSGGVLLSYPSPPPCVMIDWLGTTAHRQGIYLRDRPRGADGCQGFAGGFVMTEKRVNVWVQRFTDRPALRVSFVAPRRRRARQETALSWTARGAEREEQVLSGIPPHFTRQALFRQGNAPERPYGAPGRKVTRRPSCPIRVLRGAPTRCKVPARRITSLTGFVGCRLALFHREKPHACTVVRTSGPSSESRSSGSLAATSLPGPP